MSRNYKFHKPEAAYFVSFAVVNWLDVFTCDKYKNILVDNLMFCQKNKGMEIYAWCIMPNHAHLAFRSISGLEPGQVLGDFKRFTSKAIVKAIQENPNESRKEIFLASFRKEAISSSNVKQFKFWQHDNHPIELSHNKIVSQKIRYIHNNPVEAGLTYRPEDYSYSSAVDYAGEKGLIDDVVIVGI